MRVELNQVHRPAVILRDRAQDRKTDGVIAADAHRARAADKDRRDAPLDAAKRVFDRERIHRQIAEIGDAVLLEGIHLQHWIPGANDRGLYANITRTESRPRAIRRAAVEGNADDSDVEFVGIGDVGQAAKRRDAGEAAYSSASVGWGCGRRNSRTRLSLGMK